MKLERHGLLDALCGEYLLGTLRGAARRRFERALRSEPPVASRLREMQSRFAPDYHERISVRPSARVWRKLERELQLSRYRTPWYRSVGFWRSWAAAATAALLVVLGAQLLPRQAPELAQIAQLSGKEGAPVTASLSQDRRTLVLRTARPVLAGPNQSYELWVIPAEGGGPFSVAVLGSLDASFAVPGAQLDRLRAGATLAISVEPAGGSPTGKPTGPVILAGRIAG